jgi:hypothetical protein
MSNDNYAMPPKKGSMDEEDKQHHYMVDRLGKSACKRVRMPLLGSWGTVLKRVAPSCVK